MSIEILKESINDVIKFSEIKYDYGYKSTDLKKKQKVPLLATGGHKLSKEVSIYLDGLERLTNDIKKSETPDDFLTEYSDLCEKCRYNNNDECCMTENFISHKDALQRLYTFHNGLFNKIIDKLSELDFEILLAGSSGLASVIKKDISKNIKGFEPKDLDIYVKNISDTKIRQIDSKLRELFNKNKIYMIRRLLTLTWWIFDNNEKYITEIQLNMLTVKSWAEVFAVYHSDMVAIGYDIQNKKLITLEQRWNYFVKNFPMAYMSNLNTYDSASTLSNASTKYRNRGFIITVLSIYDSIDKKNANNGTNINTNHINPSGDFAGLNLMDKLVSVYKSCSDIILSDSIDYLYDEKEPFPLLVSMNEMDENSSFCKYVNDFEFPNGMECPIIMEKHNIVVANVNCMHDVSFKGFILMGKFLQCPICRAKFIPVIYNCINESRDNAINKYNFKKNKTTFKQLAIKKLHAFAKDNYFSENVNKSSKLKYEAIAKPDSNVFDEILNEYDDPKKRVRNNLKKKLLEKKIESESETESETESELLEESNIENIKNIKEISEVINRGKNEEIEKIEVEWSGQCVEVGWSEQCVEVDWCGPCDNADWSGSSNNNEEWPVNHEQSN